MVLKFAPSLGKFSINDTAHSAAHRLFRQRQRYQRSYFKANRYQNDHETLEVKSTLPAELSVGID
jgi:hypothetical protein